VRDGAGAADDGTPPVGDPRRGVLPVDLVDAQQPGRLGGVRREHRAALRQLDLVPQARQHAEGEGVEQHRRVPVGQGTEDGAHQRRRALGLVQPGTDDDRVGALQLRGQVRGRGARGGAVGVLGQREHAGLRRRHGERGGHGLGHRERQAAGADPERRQAREGRRAGRAAGAAHDEHPAADVLRAVPRGQRPAPQQRRREGGGVTHRPAPGAP